MKSRESSKTGTRVERKADSDGLFLSESCADPACGLFPARSAFGHCASLAS